MAKAIDKVAEFEKQFAEYKAYGIRLNVVSGTVSPEDEATLSQEYPLLTFNKTGEEATNFHLSNGKIITL